MDNQETPSIFEAIEVTAADMRRAYQLAPDTPLALALPAQYETDPAHAPDIAELRRLGYTVTFEAWPGGQCEECEGTGHTWDGSECGDPEHCGPAQCQKCGGTGQYKPAE